MNFRLKISLALSSLSMAGMWWCCMIFPGLRVPDSDNNPDNVTARHRTLTEQQQQLLLLTNHQSSSSQFVVPGTPFVRTAYPVGLEHCVTLRVPKRTTTAGAAATYEDYQIPWTNKDDLSRYLLQLQQQLQQRQQQQKRLGHLTPPRTNLRLGLEIAEPPEDFVSLGGPHEKVNKTDLSDNKKDRSINKTDKEFAFHLFHFLEYLVIFQAHLLSLLPQTPPPPTPPLPSDTATVEEAATVATAPEISWVYVPLFTRREICGFGSSIDNISKNISNEVYDGINCQLLEMFFPQQPPRIYGLESNHPDWIESADSPFAGHLKRRGDFTYASAVSSSWLLSSSSPLSGVPAADTSVAAVAAREEQAQRHQTMLSQVDAILMVDRASCWKEQIYNLEGDKIIPWVNYVADFPAQAWHQQILRALSARPPSPPTPEKQQLTAATTNNTEDDDSAAAFRVCYIDRQSIGRRLPNFFHEWWIDFMMNKQKRKGDDSRNNIRIVEFRHLHMEKYDGMEQVRLASSCHMMVGGHGNGLSHALWMAPGSSVIELYWNFYPFKHFVTAARLLQHEYLGLWDLYMPLPAWNVSLYDPLPNHHPDYEPQQRLPPWVEGSENGSEKFPQRYSQITAAQRLRGQELIESFLEQSIQRHDERRQKLRQR